MIDTYMVSRFAESVKVLQRADQIIILQAGRVVAVGKLEQLLEEAPEMQHLWQISQAGEGEEGGEKAREQ